MNSNFISHFFRLDACRAADYLRACATPGAGCWERGQGCELYDDRLLRRMKLRRKRWCLRRAIVATRSVMVHVARPPRSKTMGTRNASTPMVHRPARSHILAPYIDLTLWIALSREAERDKRFLVACLGRGHCRPLPQRWSGSRASSNQRGDWLPDFPGPGHKTVSGPGPASACHRLAVSNRISDHWKSTLISPPSLALSPWTQKRCAPCMVRYG